MFTSNMAACPLGAFHYANESPRFLHSRLFLALSYSRSFLLPCLLKVHLRDWRILHDGGGEEQGCEEAQVNVMKSTHWCPLADRSVLSLCDWLQGLEHWEEVFAVLEGEMLSLFADRAAAAEVRTQQCY